MITDTPYSHLTEGQREFVEEVIASITRGMFYATPEQRDEMADAIATVILNQPKE